MIRTSVFLLALSLVPRLFGATVDFYSTQDLAGRTAALRAKGAPFASDSLEHYGKTHYTMLAYRSATGSAEVHEREADLFVIVSGSGELSYGGQLVNGKQTKPGELRGTSLRGAERKSFGTGDVMHIPAGVPHQMMISAGKPVSYFVVKVTGQ